MTRLRSPAVQLRFYTTHTRTLRQPQRLPLVGLFFDAHYSKLYCIVSCHTYCIVSSRTVACHTTEEVDLESFSDMK
eukprot:scaffold35679_cov45-Prasinocladus_malaysianus.AAC.1